MAAMAAQAKKRDYYEVLGVDRGAGEEDLKKSYRRLAIQFHPDRNPGDKQAEERFKELNEAYQVLSDAERRAQYDRYGHAAFQGPQGNGFGFEFTQGFEEVFSDIFGDFFGTGRGRTRSRSRRGDDLRYDLEIEFEEAARGSEKSLSSSVWRPATPAPEPGRAAAPRALAPAPIAAAPDRSAPSRAFFPSPPPAANAAARARSSPTPAPSARARDASAVPNRSR